MRLIIASTPNGDKEVVIFTTDERTNSDKLVPGGFTVDYDNIIEIDHIIPDQFPIEYILERKGLV